MGGGGRDIKNACESGTCLGLWNLGGQYVSLVASIFIIVKCTWDIKAVLKIEHELDKKKKGHKHLTTTVNKVISIPLFYAHAWL